MEKSPDKTEFSFSWTIQPQKIGNWTINPMIFHSKLCHFLTDLKISNTGVIFLPLPQVWLFSLKFNLCFYKVFYFWEEKKDTL